MSPQVVVAIGKQLIITVLSVAAPMLCAGLFTGLAVTIFQSITQLRDMTLTFVPKIVVVCVTIIICLPWMMRVLIAFTTNLFLSVNQVIS